jgi:hypothetical protein
LPTGSAASGASYRANGLWETYGEVERVCRTAHLPAPKHQYASTYGRTTGSAHANRRRRTTLVLPSYQKAPGYQKLRTVPRGNMLPALALLEWIGARYGR